MAALLIAVAAAIAIVWRERTWRRTVVALRAERDQSRAELNDVSGLARDLRSPLQGVMGNTELIMATVQSGAPQVEELREIQTNVARAADIVRTIAAVAEPLTLARRWQDLNDVVVGALESTRFELAASGVRVDFDRAERLPLVYVDGRQLQRALTTLLQQLVPGARSGRQSCTATLRTRRREQSDDRLIVEFEEFAVSVDATTMADVTACRHVVEAHGGRLEVDRPSRGGYRFVLELPVWTM